MRCHSLSRSGKRGPHKGAACPPYELWEHRLFPAFSGGKTELFCIGLTVSIWVPPAPKKCSFISVRQSIWLHKLGLFLFCTPPPHPSYLQCASYPISFWRFSSNSYHLPIQERARSARQITPPQGREPLQAHYASQRGLPLLSPTEQSPATNFYNDF